MKRILRIAAVLVALGGLGYWLAAGANTGWTKNRVQKTTLDEVTGIEAVTFEDRFVPGVDFAGAVAVGAATLVAVSFLFRKKEKSAV
jgi:hypothetical protein